MNEEHARSFFSSDGSDKHFHRVIALHEQPGMDWSEVSRLAPLLPKGWYELSQLPGIDRIEFTYEFWKARLPFTCIGAAEFEHRLGEFFAHLDEIGIFLTQLKEGVGFEAHMVYSLKGSIGFFQGTPPASQEAIDSLIKRFGHIDFPADYVAFLGIHDGFSKYTDTGLIKSRDVAQVYQKLQSTLADEMLVRPDGEVIDPEHLIPFYESNILHSYQCFYADWQPESEMGNLYFSENDRSISNFLGSQDLEENMAFPSFIGWLIYYLEDVWHL